MDARRVIGLETEYGLSVTAIPGAPARPAGVRELRTEDVAGALFRRVLTWGRSSSVFLPNGGRVYLDVGNHPEYATAECDRIPDLIAQDRAGDLLLEQLVADAEASLAAQGHHVRVHLFRNNVDSAGNTFGCHENYLISRSHDVDSLARTLIPFLIVRQLLCGAGRLTTDDDGTRYVVSQRAAHIDESLSSSSTRSRPVINTRDEPHADSARFRRLHVIVGDTTMSQSTTQLKVGMADLVLRLVEAGAPLTRWQFADPHRALRTVGADTTGRAPLDLAAGGSTCAVEVLRDYRRAVGTLDLDTTAPHLAHVPAVLDLWDRAVEAIDAGRPEDVAGELDWVMKRQMLTAYAERHELPWSDPRLAQLDLAWHEVHPERGVFRRWESAGRAGTVIPTGEARRALSSPPQTTRAKLRGEFVHAARRHQLDHTVDWVHLRLDAGSRRAVVCPDPLQAADPRVERLIESMHPAVGDADAGRTSPPPVWEPPC